MVGMDLPLSSPLGSEALGLNPSEHGLGAMIALLPHCYTFHLGPVQWGVVGSTPHWKSGGMGLGPSLGINLFQKVVGQMVWMGG